MPSHSVKHLQDCRGRFAPQPSYYKDVSKYCGNCGKPLTLRNNRDIVRRNYCSLNCRSRGAANTEAFKSNAIKQCRQCGADFTAKTFSQKYCSLNCCGISAMGAFRKRRAASLEGFLKALIRSKNKRNGLTTDSLLHLTTAQLIDWCRKIVEHNQEDR